ncbi:MAG: alanine racemase [Anaerolineae bacterium]|nr:alanine racemase [Anaerolineae bacterium]
MPPVTELETPCILIDIPQMQANIARMQAHCDQHGLDCRPHVKTHKVPEIAQMQMEAGAVGIACQKLSEAQVFIDEGFGNIQIPYNVVGPSKTARLADMALYNRVTVSADHVSVIAGLSDAAAANEIVLRVMVELATELERTGAPVSEVLQLAQKIDADDHLHFAGLLVYPSNPIIRPALQEALDALHRAGIGVDIVSGGGMDAALRVHEMPELTELRVGTYIFNDYGSVRRGLAALDECAMTALATVVSRPTSDRAILDSGSKTLSAINDKGVYGFILDYPDAILYNLNEEHAFVDLSRCDEKPVIGERVRIVPVQAGVVSNLHNQLFGVVGEAVEAIWTVAARGMVW